MQRVDILGCIWRQNQASCETGRYANMYNTSPTLFGARHSMYTSVIHLTQHDRHTLSRLNPRVIQRPTCGSAAQSRCHNSGDEVMLCQRRDEGSLCMRQRVEEHQPAVHVEYERHTEKCVQRGTSSFTYCNRELLCNIMMTQVLSDLNTRTPGKDTAISSTSTAPRRREVATHVAHA